MTQDSLDRITGEDERRRLLNRLRRLEGQVRGVQSMISGGQECEAVLTQVMAARSALGKIGLHVTGYAMKQCLVDDKATGEALVDDAFATFMEYRRVAADATPAPRKVPTTPEGMVDRLGELEGELGAVERLLDKAGPCEQLVAQIGSATVILSDVALGVLGHSMRQCLVDPDAERDKVIDDAVAVFLKYSSCLG